MSLLNCPADALDPADPEIASLARHLQAFNASVMESGNPLMASFMSAFSPELHALDIIARVIDTLKAALGARDASVFTVDRWASLAWAATPPPTAEAAGWCTCVRGRGPVPSSLPGFSCVSQLSVGFRPRFGCAFLLVTVAVGVVHRDAFLLASCSERHELVSHVWKDSAAQRYPIAGLPLQAYSSRRLVHVADCSSDPRLNHGASALAGLQLQYTLGAAICCPILASLSDSADPVIGVLQVQANWVGVGGGWRQQG